jgi:hypothetical protein
MKRFIFIAAPRHPFEVWLFLACALSGIIGIFAPEQSTGLVGKIFPDYFMTYNFCILIGGVMGLAGMMHRRNEDVPFSLAVERLALSLLGTLFLIYGMAIVFAAPSSGAGAILILSLPVVAVWRIYQITRDLKLIHTTLNRPADSESDGEQ